MRLYIINCKFYIFYSHISFINNVRFVKLESIAEWTGNIPTIRCNFVKFYLTIFIALFRITCALASHYLGAHNFKYEAAWLLIIKRYAYFSEYIQLDGYAFHNSEQHLSCLYQFEIWICSTSSMVCRLLLDICISLIFFNVVRFVLYYYRSRSSIEYLVIRHFVFW